MDLMDWLRSEDLKEEKNVTAPVVIIAVDYTLSLTIGCEAYHLAMHRMNPEHLEPHPSDRSLLTDILLREEPEDEEEDEEEHDGGGEDDDGDEGYSE